EGGSPVQAAEGGRVARRGHSLQVRHQGQQGGLASEPAMTQAPGEDRALSLDEAMSVAILLQQNEQWTAAADIYRSILAADPCHADALHYSGVLAHQQAQGDDAIALIERSLE